MRLVLLLALAAALVVAYIALVRWEGPLAEGPYRKAESGRCVCR